MADQSTAPAPLVAAGFAIRVEGSAKPAAYFTTLDGISSEVEVVGYTATDSTLGTTLHTKHFGRNIPPTVTLSRGVDGTATLWAWHQMALAGDPQARMSCTLEFTDKSGKPVVTYWLNNAWPSKLEIDAVSTDDSSSEIVVETVTFTCESIEQRPPSGG